MAGTRKVFTLLLAVLLTGCPGDFADETVLKTRQVAAEPCKPGEIKCAYNVNCIQVSQLCDGRIDCENGDDENQCSSRDLNFRCSKDEWRCFYEDKCIPMTWRCNVRNDCSARGDEKDCGEFYRCVGAQEIPRDFVCDRIVDCPNADDEYPNCIGNYQRDKRDAEGKNSRLDEFLQERDRKLQDKKKEFMRND